MVLQPIIRRAVAISRHSLRVAGFLHIQKHPAPQHPADAKHLRTVGIFRCFAFGMMLAVNRRPFLGDHASGKPKPEPKEVTGDRVQIQRPVSLGGGAERW